MRLKYILSLLVIICVPVFLGLIKLTSLLLILLFDANKENSIAYSIFIIITAALLAVGVYCSVEDEKGY
jgi:hypothetical protein